MEQNYSQMVADETDPDKRARMMAQLDAAKLSYTKPTAPTSSTMKPTDYQTPEDYASKYALQIGAENRSKVASGELNPDGTDPKNANRPLVTFYDTAGRPHEVFADSQLPAGWSTTPTNQQNTLQQAVQGSNTQSLPKKDYAYTPASDNSRLISQSFDEQKASAVAALKAAIEKAKGGYKSIASEATTAYDPLKNQTTVAKNEQLGRLRESMANQGQVGGVSRSEELQVQTSAENQLNSINQQQQKVIEDANKSITELEANGQLQEAQIVSENANNKIRALIEEANRIESTNYSRKQDALTNQRYDEQLALESQRYENEQQKAKTAKELEATRYNEDVLSKEQQKLESNYAATINPLDDQTAIIQKLKSQGVPDDDYRVIAHQKVRVAKLGQMADQQYQAELARIKDEDERQEQAFETAKWKFEQGMPADSVTASLLKIPMGTIIPSQRIKEAQLQLDKIKASKSSSSGTSKPRMTYTEAFKQAKSLKPNGTVSELDDIANQLMTGNVSQQVSEMSQGVKQPTSSTAKSALDYLTKLENARDLTAINAFMNNNAQELEMLENTGSESEKAYAKEVRKRFNKYK